MLAGIKKLGGHCGEFYPRIHINVMNQKISLGIDIGSTTVKVAFLDEQNHILFSDYERHFANIRETLLALVQKAHQRLGQMEIYPMITGSGGMSLSKAIQVPFVQEVISVSSAADYCSTNGCCHCTGWRGRRLFIFPAVISSNV